MFCEVQIRVELKRQRMHGIILYNLPLVTFERANVFIKFLRFSARVFVSISNEIIIYYNKF